MRVMGIDCGGSYTGYGVVDQAGVPDLNCGAAGAIRLKWGDAMASKLQKIFTDLTAIMSEHQPEVVAIEEVFYASNVKSALKLGQVRGVAMLAAASLGLPVAEYYQLSIKTAVVGFGRDDRYQVQPM